MPEQILIHLSENKVTQVCANKLLRLYAVIDFST